MDKNEKMQALARALNEKDCFNGAWLYAENGEIEQIWHDDLSVGNG